MADCRLFFLVKLDKSLLKLIIASLKLLVGCLEPLELGHHRIVLCLFALTSKVLIEEVGRANT
jgi:hypothetical protein